MIKLKFKVNCIEGEYCFVFDYENKNYIVNTNINGLVNVEEELKTELVNEFIYNLNEATIEKWDRHYDGVNKIEDGIKWSVKYYKDESEYVSDGLESYEPYKFEYLIKAIKICDKQIEYFGW